MDPDELTQLADRYGTDKGTRARTAHNYTPHYHRYLSERRADVGAVLEIGIGKSDVPGLAAPSLKMWRDYFPQARIDGIDIRDRSMVLEDRIETFVLDAGDPIAWYGFLTGRSYDLIIDDGSHRVDHQLITLAACFHALNPGGIYIVEDLVPADGTPQPIDGTTHVGPAPSRYNRTGTAMVTEAVLQRFVDGGELPSEFLGPNDRLYLEANIASVEIIAGAWWPKTAVLVKKDACI
ncbi:MAG: class I SAM-dependent methyltransferase [Acidimicrobiales bacterium]|jgi:hypothetical protein|nr:class I SAM-dependent methyltransferase [Acidimicrobiales bacterium]